MVSGKDLIMIKLLITSLFFISLASQASKVIELTAGLPKPPFVIGAGAANEGIQLDLIRAIFEQENRLVKFTHVSLARSFVKVEQWHTDGVITFPATHHHDNAYLSEPYIQYQNVAISLEEDEITIDKLADLKDKQIVAFPRAKQFLGDNFVNAIKQATEYREITDQMRQVKMLFAKRTQVLIMDVSIFRHFLLMNQDARYTKDFKVHYLFEPRMHSAAFKNELDRDQFNQGLKKIKSNGQYQQILDKYLF
jgi:polar amino acid transport system substrate-binding protein